KDLPVEHRRAADVGLGSDQRARAELAGFILRRAGPGDDEADVALVLRQHGVAGRVQVELRPAIALDHQPREVAVRGGVAALGRRGPAELGYGRAEALPKDDVHDLLV